MSSNNFLPFPVQENAQIPASFIQQCQHMQGLAMPMSSTMLSSPPFYCSSSGRSRLLVVRRRGYMIHKLRHVRARMCAALRFGVGIAGRPRAPLLRIRAPVIRRQMPVTNHHHQIAAAFTCFQGKCATSNLLERFDSTVETDGRKDEKLKDVEDQQDDGLDLSLKL